MKKNNLLSISWAVAFLFLLPTLLQAGWVAVGERGMLLTSTDGINWILGDSGFLYDPSAPLRTVSTDSAGNWLVGGGNGLVLSSNDGETWQTVSSGTSEVLWGSDFASGPGHPQDLWLLSGGGAIVLTSPDRNNWTSHKNNLALTLFELASNPLGMYVAVGGTSNAITMWSSDAISWHQNPPQASQSLKGIVYGKEKWVAVGDGGVIFTNPDPSAGGWTKQVSGSGNTLWDVVYDGSNLFVAVGADGTVLTSSDGIGWVVEDVGQAGNDLTGVAYDGSLFVAVGESGHPIIYSYDGHIWFTTPNPSGFQLRDVAAGILPKMGQVDITKTADRAVVIASGATVTFTIVVSNTGETELIVSSLVDDVFGDLNGQGTCVLPQSLAVNDSYSCTFSGPINDPDPPLPSIHRNEVTVTATYDGGSKMVTALDSQTVYMLVPVSGGGIIGQLVWYDKNADNQKGADEPGVDGVSVILRNALNQIVDTTTTADGGQYFFNVAVGSYSVEVVIPPSVADSAVLTTDSNPASIVIRSGDIALGVNFGFTIASIKARKKVDKTVVASSPSDVTYTVTVENTSALDVELRTLTDNKFGDLDGQGTCALPASIPPYGSYTCSFSETITGADGDFHVNIVSARAADQENHDVVSAGLAYVRFDIGFPWIPLPPCATFPLHCYILADGDKEGGIASRLFKYTFRGKSYEAVNELGTIDVESMTSSLDGKTIYAVNGGVLGTIDPTPGLTNSFVPIDSTGLGSGSGTYGRVAFLDIDGLTFDPTDGTLYGTVRYMEESPGMMDLLIKIDPQTGTAIANAFGAGRDYVVIEAGPGGVKDVDGIAIDRKGILYGVIGNTRGGGNDQFVIIDKQTGAVSGYTPLLQADGSPVQDMEAFTLYNHRQFYGATGIEFAALGMDNSLYKIEKDSGTTEFVTPLDIGFDGYVPADFEAITCFPVCNNK